MLNYCEVLNETYVDLSVSPRREKKMFSFEAFKEAWINACVHNKWVEGVPPAVYWFDDRVEIISYGGIPKGLTKEEFLSGKTKHVNKELMDIFLQCDIVEQSGHGVPIIVREYGKSAYKFSESSITVVIPFEKNGFEKGKEIGKEIIELVKINPTISVKELSNKMGVTIRVIRYQIEKLRKDGIIIREGSTKSGKWIIKK